MNLFLSGPMRGHPQFNQQAFDQAATQLRAAGHQVWSPVERDRELGHDWTGCAGTIDELDQVGFSIPKAMQACLDWVLNYSDAVALLAGWTHSTGSLLEAYVASTIGLPLFHVDRQGDLHPLDPTFVLTVTTGRIQHR